MLFRRIIFGGNGRPRNETGKRGLKAKIITWHDFKSFSPYELEQPDNTADTLSDTLRDHRKIRNDTRPVGSSVSEIQKSNSIGYGILRLVVQAGNTPEETTSL